MACNNDNLTIAGGYYLGFRVDSYEYECDGHFEIVGFRKRFYSLQEVRIHIDNHITEGVRRRQ